RAVIGNAENWAHRVGATDIGVRHLIAAYVLNPPAAHREQMQDRWQFTEGSWHALFFDWVAQRYSAEQWGDARHRPALFVSHASFDTATPISGRTLAFPSDEDTDRVLARAAEYHALSSDRWLRLQTVFRALVEEAAGEPRIRAAIEPIMLAVAGAYFKYGA